MILRISKCVVLFLLALSICSIARAQQQKVQTLSVTNSPLTITADMTGNAVVVRENSASPTAVFSVTLAGTTTAQNYAAGTQFVFNGPYVSGQVIGTIVATTAGPFSFTAVESNGTPSMSAKASSSGGGAPSGPAGGCFSGNYPNPIFGPVIQMLAGNQTTCIQGNWNTKQITDATITNASPTVTSTAQAAFTSADVGKTALGFTSCHESSLTGVTTILGASSLVTISAVNSATSITVSANASGSSGAGTGCLIYGTPDDTAFASLDTLAAAETVCPAIRFPQGNTIWTSWHLENLALTPCDQNPQVTGQTIFGGGLDIGGAGNGQTEIYLAPSI